MAFQSIWYYTDLPEDIVDGLWKLIEESRKQPEDMKPELAGNISSSIRLDGNSPLIEDFVKNIIPKYLEETIKTFPPNRVTMKDGQGWNLESLWVNFQKKHEFNPYHDHGGVYSFVVWLRIPYEHAEQNNLPFLQGVKEQDRKAGMFEFQYYDIFGRTTHHGYRLGKDVEGVMLFFPAMFKHTVYPFYNTDETRVSVSGNLWLRPHV